MIKENLLRRIKTLAEDIYGRDAAEDILELVDDLAQAQGVKPLQKIRPITQEDSMLITYGDLLSDGERPPLQVLQDFLKEFLQGTVSAVHILPFFPYSSDDGFSVIDYWQVDNRLGSWDDVSQIAQDFDLMFDAVINHISAQSKWFRAYVEGDPEYEDFFIEADPDLDYSMVTRPRALPLLTPFETKMGKKHLWTTFSADQIDLNFASPEVLKRWIELFFFYVRQGARFIRLDAIGYLWKELGTSCIHLKQTHQIVQLLRAVAEIADPSSRIITETNVPHKDNVSYFGDGTNEAHLVYQFPLPPLVLHSILAENCKALSLWAHNLKPPPGDTTFLNFLASHDGIGVMPVIDLISADELDSMINTVKRRGGYVSYKHNPDGTESPYELNINYLSALHEPGEPDNYAVERFITAHSILFSLIGMPAIYMHSILGSINYREGVKSSGIKRRINREKLRYQEIIGELNDPDSRRSRVFFTLRKMLKIRRAEAAFEPSSPQQILFLKDEIFAVKRGSPKCGAVISINNVSSTPQHLHLSKDTLGDALYAVDLLSNERYDCEAEGLQLTITPRQACWLKLITV